MGVHSRLMGGARPHAPRDPRLRDRVGLAAGVTGAPSGPQAMKVWGELVAERQRRRDLGLPEPQRIYLPLDQWDALCEELEIRPKRFINVFGEADIFPAPEGLSG